MLSLIKKTDLKILLISLTFNQALIFLHKYPCLGFNKSVLNWTFCQLLYSWKNPIVRKYHHKNITKLITCEYAPKFMPILVKITAEKV